MSRKVETVRKGRNAWMLRITFSFAIFAIIIGTVLVASGRPLLKRATDLGRAVEFELWVSDHQYALLDWPPFPAGPPTVVVEDPMIGTISKGVVRTCTTQDHAVVKVSPDGKRVLFQCRERTANGGVNSDIRIYDLASGRTQAWKAIGDCRHYTHYWMPDSQRWLSLSTLPSGYLMINDLKQPEKQTRLQFSDYKVAGISPVYHHYEVSGQGHLLVYSNSTELGMTNKSGAHLEISEYALGGAVTPMRTARFAIPKGNLVQDIAFSHDGNSVAWVQEREYVHPIVEMLHRFVPAIPAKPQRQSSLWASDLAGKPHEIGAVEQTGDDTHLSNLRWIPHTDRLSFTYKDKLYSIGMK